MSSRWENLISECSNPFLCCPWIMALSFGNRDVSHVLPLKKQLWFLVLKRRFVMRTEQADWFRRRKVNRFICHVLGKQEYLNRFKEVVSFGTKKICLNLQFCNWKTHSRMIEPLTGSPLLSSPCQARSCANKVDEASGQAPISLRVDAKLSVSELNPSFFCLPNEIGSKE